MSQLLSGRTILLVEDEVIIGIDLGNALEAEGAEVIWLHNLATTLQALPTRNFDAAVLDYRLPDGLSTEICEELERRKIPYLIHTGYSHIEGACSQAEKVEKPVHPDEIVRRIEKLLCKPSPPSTEPEARP